MCQVRLRQVCVRDPIDCDCTFKPFMTANVLQALHGCAHTRVCFLFLVLDDGVASGLRQILALFGKCSTFEKAHLLKANKTSNDAAREKEIDDLFHNALSLLPLFPY